MPPAKTWQARNAHSRQKQRYYIFQKNLPRHVAEQEKIHILAPRQFWTTQIYNLKAIQSDIHITWITWNMSDKFYCRLHEPDSQEYITSQIISKWKQIFSWLWPQRQPSLSPDVRKNPRHSRLRKSKSPTCQLQVSHSHDSNSWRNRIHLWGESCEPVHSN